MLTYKQLLISVLYYKVNAVFVSINDGGGGGYKTKVPARWVLQPEYL